MNVLEEDNQRAPASELGKQLPRRPEDLLALDPGSGASDRLQEARRELFRPFVLRRRSVRGVSAMSWPTISRSDQKVIPSPVGDAAADDDSCRPAGLRGEFLGQPRLPDARRAQDREHAKRSLAHDPGEIASEAVELGLTPDQRRLQRADDRPPVPQLDDAPRAARFGLDRLAPGGVANQPLGLVSEQDLARAGRVLELAGLGQRLADDREFPGR